MEVSPLVMVPVTSSNVRAVGYSDRPAVLVVQFQTGAYAYPGIPRAIYEALLLAPSKGAFVNRVLKPWPATKLARLIALLPVTVADPLHVTEATDADAPLRV